MCPDVLMEGVVHVIVTTESVIQCRPQVLDLRCPSPKLWVTFMEHVECQSTIPAANEVFPIERHNESPYNIHVISGFAWHNVIYEELEDGSKKKLVGTKVLDVHIISCHTMN